MTTSGKEKRWIRIKDQDNIKTKCKVFQQYTTVQEHLTLLQYWICSVLITKTSIFFFSCEELVQEKLLKKIAQF